MSRQVLGAIKILLIDGEPFGERCCLVPLVITAGSTKIPAWPLSWRGRLHPRASRGHPRCRAPRRARRSLLEPVAPPGTRRLDQRGHDVAAADHLADQPVSWGTSPGGRDTGPFGELRRRRFRTGQAACRNAIDLRGLGVAGPCSGATGVVCVFGDWRPGLGCFGVSRR